MLNYHLVVLPTGGTEPVLQANSRERAEPDFWAQLCLLRVERAVSAAKEFGAPLDLFICAAGDEIRDRQDEGALAALLERCSAHGWGSRCFLVAMRDEHLPLDILAREARHALEDWLKTAWKGGVTDILQAPYEPYGASPPRGIDLHRAVKWVERRQALLDKLRAAHYSDERPWRCLFLHSESWGNETLKSATELLGPWMQYPKHDDGANLVLLIRGHGSPSDRLEAEVGRYHDRQILVATLHRGVASVLESDCQRLGLAPPVFLAGVLELWYFLLLLNRSQNPGPTTALGQLVKLDQEPVFTFEHPMPKILITSSFMPSQPRHCLDAAKEVGRLLAKAPRELRSRIEPAIDCSRLSRLLDKGHEPEIWIHLGHGTANHGLNESGKENPCPPEEWLACFKGRRTSLMAVMFLTCDSANAARVFARAGVRVALGFDGKATGILTQEVAVRILDAILEEGPQPAAILRGFRAGQERLLERLRTDPRLRSWNCVPRAYYPGAL